MQLQELELEIALDYWSFLLEGKFKFLEEWIEFYHPRRHGRFISQDTWNKVLIFAWKVDHDLGECMVVKDDDDNDFRCL